jgi:arabinofuranan 3-O-arabinosyltransferase
VPSAVLGVVAMGFAYTGSGGGSFGPLGQDLLDGALAPFRNVHKFAGVVRLPLALGVGHLASVAWQERPAGAPTTAVPHRRVRARARVVGPPALALGLVVLSIAPAVGGRLTAPGSFRRIPAAWEDAARWLDRHEGTSRSLILPGSSFGEYAWGRPLDEPLGALIRGDWAIRDLIPLGGNGSTRLLDGIDTALLAEQLPVGFVPALQRAGVRYLVVRNDLDLPRTGGPSPASMRRILATAPELHRVASFRGRADARAIGGDARLAADVRTVVRPAAPEIEIYSVPHPLGRVTTYPASGAVVLSGGPEGLLQVPPSVTGDRAVVLAVDEPSTGLTGVERVATDTGRRRDVLFGSIRSNASPTLAPGEPAPVSGEPPEDRWPGDGPELLTDARIDGAATIADDAPRTILLDAERGPAAAFDGNPSTTWDPSRQDRPAPGHWLQVTFERPRVVPSVTLRIPSVLGRRVATARIDTDHTSRTAAIGSSGSVRIALGSAPTQRVRITIASVVSGVETGPVGFSEVELAGVTVRRSVQVAPTGRTAATRRADAAYLARLRRDPFARYRGDEEGRLDRWVTTTAIPDAKLSGTAVAVPGPALDAAIPERPRRLDRASATATSRWHDQPAFDATSAIDGDPGSAWVSAPEVDSPALTITWPQPVRISKLTIDVAAAPPFDGIDVVSVRAGTRRVDRTLGDDGTISIPPTTTSTLTLGFPRQGGTDQRVVAISEVHVDGVRLAAARPRRADPVAFACGRGPDLTVDGTSIPTRASTTVGQLIDGAAIAWEACDGVDLRVGEHHIDAGPSRALAVATLAVEPAGPRRDPAGGRTDPARAVLPTSWGRERRTVGIDAGSASVLATTENFNAGWVATMDGTTLTPIRVDGWRQGWLVPAGPAGTVHLTYRPATPQHVGLLVGALALLALVALAVVPGRRHPGAAPAADLTERPWPAWASLGLAAVAGVALAGPAVLVLLPLLVLPHRDRVLPWVTAAAAVGAGVVAFITPKASLVDHDGTLSLPAQLLATVAVLALAAAAVDHLPGRRAPAPADPVS